MTIGIIPESDRKGRAVCQFWLQGGKHNVTDKHPSDLLTAPPFFGREETTRFPEKNSLKRTHKRDSNPAKRRRF